jgi:hypothetical protein
MEILQSIPLAKNEKGEVWKKSLTDESVVAESVNPNTEIVGK